MLSTLVALSLAVQTQAADAASIFPPVNLGDPNITVDSEIFPYLKGSKEFKMVAPYDAGSDWTKLAIPAPKPDAQKLKVLLFVADRDFSNPAFSNILEMRDKQRLITAMSRLSAMMRIVSEGEFELELIPKFVPEPFFSQDEIKQFVMHEFNRYKFDADDSEERGPFSAMIALTGSSPRRIAVGSGALEVNGFHDLGGTKPQLNLEENILKMILTQVFAGSAVHEDLGSVPKTRVASFDSPLSLFNGKFKPLLGVNQYNNQSLNLEWLKENVNAKGLQYKRTDDNQLVEISGRQKSWLDAPVELTKTGSELSYIEKSLTRDGGFAIPMLNGDESRKSFQFELKSASANPVAVQFWTGKGIQHEVLVGDIPDAHHALQSAGAIKVSVDGTWQTVKVNIPKDFAVSGITIGAPLALKFTPRRRDETVNYVFRGFKFSDELGFEEASFMPIAKMDETMLEQMMTAGSIIAKRTALKHLLSQPPVARFKEIYIALGRDIDAFTARHAVLNLIRLPLEITDPVVTMYLKGLVTTAPTEVAREAALLAFEQKPEFATFESVAANTVRKSWRTRLAGVKALAAIDKTNLQAKPAARALLMNCAGQDLAMIRLFALQALNRDVEPERKKLEYALVNDPSEWNRIEVCGKLAKSGTANTSPTDVTVLESSLADESPAVRVLAHTSKALEIIRKELQRKIVDVDPKVRSSALRMLLIQFGDAKVEEYENLLQDDNVFVVKSMFTSYEVVKRKLPDTYLAKMKTHPSAFVRSLVENYGR
jgi:hypothetical protein